MKLVLVLLAFSMVYLTDGFVYAPPFHQTARKNPHQHPILIEVPWKILSLRPSEPKIQMEEYPNYQLQPGPTADPLLRYSKKK